MNNRNKLIKFFRLKNVDAHMDLSIALCYFNYGNEKNYSGEGQHPIDEALERNSCVYCGQKLIDYQCLNCF